MIMSYILSVCITCLHVKCVIYQQLAVYLTKQLSPNMTHAGHSHASGMSPQAPFHVQAQPHSWTWILEAPAPYAIVVNFKFDWLFPDLLNMHLISWHQVAITFCSSTVTAWFVKTRQAFDGCLRTPPCNCAIQFLVEYWIVTKHMQFVFR